MRILIIEDEPPAQEELARIIKKRFPQMETIGRLTSVKESIEWLRENKADLIFMDIHLADGNCFDIFSHVEIHTPIIFTTAYDQYAIQAFKVNGIGYLLKPIVESDLAAAVKKLEYRPEKFSELLNAITSSLGYKSRTIIKSGDKFNILKMEDVAYFYAEERVTFVVPKQGKKQIVGHTIEALESLLDPKRFFRINRSCIASIDAIESVSKYFNSRLKVCVRPEFGDKLLVSRARAPKFLKWLESE